MKIHHYKLRHLKNYGKRLFHILTIWSEFIYLNSSEDMKLHILICHKITWSYLRQGLLSRKIYSMKFANYPYSEKHPVSALDPEINPNVHRGTSPFSYDSQVQDLLEDCHFQWLGKKWDPTKKRIIYFYKLA